MLSLTLREAWRWELKLFLGEPRRRGAQLILVLMKLNYKGGGRQDLGIHKSLFYLVAVLRYFGPETRGVGISHLTN